MSSIYIPGERLLKAVASRRMRELVPVARAMEQGAEDTFGRQAEVVGPMYEYLEESLLNRIRKIREGCAKAFGYATDLLPPIHGNTGNPRPTPETSHFSIMSNEISLTDTSAQTFRREFRLDDTVSHEDLHGYVSNLMTAWAYHLPEEYIDFAKKTTIREILNIGSGETIIIGCSATNSKELTRNREEFFANFRHTLKNDLLNDNQFSEEEREIIASVLANIIEDSDASLFRAHKWARLELEESSRHQILQETLPKLSRFTHNLSETEPGANPADVLQTFIESRLKDALTLYKTCQRQFLTNAQQYIKPEYLTVPFLTEAERKKVAGFLKLLLDHPDKYLEKIPESGYPAMNNRAVSLLNRKLLPCMLEDYIPQFKYDTHIDDTAARNSAQEELVRYVNGLLYRFDQLAGSHLIGKNELLPSAMRPLNDKEVKFAKRVVSGKHSTQEGNIKVDDRHYRNGWDKDYSYLVKAWEELIARRQSAAYRLFKAEHRIRKLERQGFDKSTDKRLKRAYQVRTRMNKDLRLLKIFQDLVKLETKIRQAPQDLSRLRAIKRDQTAFSHYQKMIGEQTDKIQEVKSGFGKWSQTPLRNIRKGIEVARLSLSTLILKFRAEKIAIELEQTVNRPELLMESTVENAALLDEWDRLVRESWKYSKGNKIAGGIPTFTLAERA